MRGFLKTFRSNPKARVEFGQPSARNLLQLSQHGLSVAGFTRSLQGADGAHILDHHGRGTKKYKAGSRASQADFAKIPKIVDAAHHVEVYTRLGKTRIKYTANVGGKRYSYVETVGRKKKRLLATTLWRKN